MTTQQSIAIKKTTGPCLIMAGAGTGKTYTIVQKIIYLIENNICRPEEILCLTFSNEATNNLRENVLEKLKTADMTIRTFHGFCADIVRELGEKIKIDRGFDILLPEDAKVWFYRYLEASPYYASQYATSVSTIKDFGISMQQIEDYANALHKKLACKDPDSKAKELELEIKTLHLLPSDTKEERSCVKERKKEINAFLDVYDVYKKYTDFIAAWKRYEQLKKERNVLDYADLNFNALEIFKRFGAKGISGKYKYVFVDEFQDTNKQQFELIEHIAPHRNITVVGDPNQSIYGFRGAYRESFNHFKEVFGVDEKADIFKLDKSYRSPNKALRIAHMLIKNNYEDPKECFLVENVKDIEGEAPKVIQLKRGEEEARRVSEIVEEEIAKGTPLCEIGVLYRTHAQGKLLRQALEARNIPIIAAGRTDIMQMPEIRTAIAYLSILNNLRNRTGTGEQSWWDLFHYHNALTPQDSVKIGRFLKKNRDMAIDEAMLNKIKDIDLSKAGNEIVARIIAKLKEMLKASNKALPDLVLDVYEIAGLNRAFTHERTIRNVEALMNLNQFYKIAESYYRTHEKSLSSFIEYVEILDKLEVEIPSSKINDINAVRVMTMHSVKGLEFKTVIVTNLAEKRFPLERTSKEPLIPKEMNPDIKRYLDSLGKLDEKETEEAIKEYEKMSLLFEERRLGYVAFTRVKENLIITFARSYNKEEDSADASMFLKEIDFINNKDIILEKDDEEKCTIFAPCSKYEQFKSLLKKQLMDALDTDDFNVLLSRLVTYHAVREGEIADYEKTDWKKVIDKEDLNTHIKLNCGKCSCLKFDPLAFTFSPTALLTYDECPKKYELSHIFQMPERGAFEWSGADTGSFVHDLFEKGVKEGFSKKEDFVKRAVEMAELPDYEDVDLEDVNSIIDVFWERHKGRYNSKSKVEGWLNLEIGGFRFNGKYDRIDFIKGKDVEIIDYKTNAGAVEPKKRAWQLGFYALGVKKTLGLNPVKLTLEMLRLEKPFEAEVDSAGNVTAGRSKGFNINDVEKELIECAKSIVKDYEGEFRVVEDDGKCKWCGYKFYCPKWEE